MKNKIKKSLLKRFLLISILIALGLYTLLLSAIYLDSGDSPESTAAVAIVLGSKVNEDGSLSPRLKARLDEALKLYQNQQVKQILVSGGLGKEGHDEAQVMATYLTTQNIPSEQLIIDSEGYTTSKTAQNAAKLIPTNQPIIVVSQQFHVSRAKMAMRHAGFTQVYDSYPNYYETRCVYSSLREVPAWLQYFVLQK